MGRPNEYDDPKEAQRIANKRYREKNREHVNYMRLRSSTKNFILNYALSSDLDNLEELIREKRANL